MTGIMWFGAGFCVAIVLFVASIAVLGWAMGGWLTREEKKAIKHENPTILGVVRPLDGMFLGPAKKTSLYPANSMRRHYR